MTKNQRSFSVESEETPQYSQDRAICSNYRRLSANVGQDVSRDVIKTRVRTNPPSIRVRGTRVQPKGLIYQHTPLWKTSSGCYAKSSRGCFFFGRKDHENLYANPVRSDYYSSTRMIKDQSVFDMLGQNGNGRVLQVSNPKHVTPSSDKHRRWEKP